MRVLAYMAAILSGLVLVWGLWPSYEYALIDFGLKEACCNNGFIHPQLGDWIIGGVALLFPLTALAVLIWFVLSGFAARRPEVVLAVSLVLAVLGYGFALVAALGVTPL